VLNDVHIRRVATLASNKELTINGRCGWNAAKSETGQRMVKILVAQIRGIDTD
jgi:hypothetical protein